MGYHKSHTDIIYQEVLYVQYSEKHLVEPKDTVTVILIFRFSVTLSIASFIYLGFLKQICEFLILCLSRNVTNWFDMIVGISYLQEWNMPFVINACVI